jgi:hypothetical protein
MRGRAREDEATGSRLYRGTYVGVRRTPTDAVSDTAADDATASNAASAAAATDAATDAGKRDDRTDTEFGQQR